MIDKGSTLTRTRTKVRSNVITETYAAADNNDQFTGGFSTAATNQPIRPSQKPLQVYQYLSLGPQIYAKIKTMFSTILFSTLIVCFEKRMKGLETKVLFFQTNQYCHTAFARLAISSS